MAQDRLQMQMNRTITLVVALSTLTSNVLSSVLFRQLPDDPFHLARNFGLYLHVANVLSVFGFVGALREHALSISMFSNYLILDSIVCCIPRALALGFLRDFSFDLCSLAGFSTQEAGSQIAAATLSSPATSISFRSSYTPDLPYPTGQWDSFSSHWSQDGCVRIVTLARWTLVAGLMAGTVMQFWGALYVRKYANGLWVRDILEEEISSSAVGRRIMSEEDELSLMKF